MSPAGNSQAGSRLSDNYRGAAYMAAAMGSFAVNDVISKAFASEFGVGQLLLLRGALAIVMVSALARALGHLRPLKSAFKPLLAVRSLGEMIATYCFMKALFNIPLADLSAVMQALPLALTLGAAWLYGESIGWRRYTAIGIGFVGVLVIVRPGMQGFSIYSLWSLGAVAACVVRDLATRRLGADVPSMFVTLLTTVSVTIMGGLVALAEPWTPVEPWHLGLMVCSAVFLLIGYYYAIAAMRVGEIGFVSPFRYLVLLFSIVGAALVYAEYPDRYTLLGAAIVVATGVYTLYRERVVRKQAITPPPTRS